MTRRNVEPRARPIGFQEMTGALSVHGHPQPRRAPRGVTPPVPTLRDAGHQLLARVELQRSRSPEQALRTARQGLVRLSTLALSLARSGHDPPKQGSGSLAWQRGMLLRASAHILRGLSRHREAATRYIEAWRAFRESGDLHEAARCAIGRTDALMYLGAYERARTEGASALRALIAVGDAQAAARLRNNLANIEYRQDRLEQALHLYARARHNLLRAGQSAAVGRIDANRANCFALRGRPVEAARLLAAARSSFRRAGLPLDAAACDYALAYLLFLQHRYMEALFALAALEPTFDALGARDFRALLDLDAAEIYLRLGRPADAEVAAAKASESFGALGLRYEEAKANYFEGVACLARGGLDAARSLLEKAESSFLAEGNRVWVAQCRLAAADCERAGGHLHKARRLARLAAREFASAGDPEREGLAWVAIGRAAMTRREPAREAIRCARSCAKRARSAYLAYRIACLEGDSAFFLGQSGPARLAYGQALRISESLAGRVRTELFRAMDWSSWDEAFPKLAAVEADAGRPAALFRILERGRARAFELPGDETGSALRRRSRVSQQLERRLRDLSCRLEARRSGAWKPGRSGEEPVAGFERQDHEVARALERIDREMRARSSGSSVDSPRIRELAASLDENDLLVEFFDAAGDLGLIAIQKRGTHLRPKIVPSSRVQAWMEEIAFLARSEPLRAAGAGTALLAAVREAGDALLGPVAEWMSRREELNGRLVIVPSGRMASLPWVSFARWTGLRARSVSVVPSAAFWLARRKAPARKGAVVLLGLGDRNAPQVEAELLTLTRRLPSSRVLVGKNATVAKLRKALVGAAWLHVAGHGHHDAQRPILSGIRLSDRWAHLADLTPQGRAPASVVLAACRTGDVVGGWRNDWQGLAGGLLRAGGASVIASLWEVDDAWSRKLSEELYGRLLLGQTVGEALAGAQRNPGDDPTTELKYLPWGVFGWADLRLPQRG